jgi:hypothetical protein
MTDWFNAIRSKGKICTCTNIIFIRIGVINSGNFKGSEELEEFKNKVIEHGLSYIHYANQLGHYALYFRTIGTYPVAETDRMIPRLLRSIKHPTFFGGQLVFNVRYSFEKFLHNHTIFMIQRKLFKRGIPVIILPVNVPDKIPPVGKIINMRGKVPKFIKTDDSSPAVLLIYRFLLK